MVRPVDRLPTSIPVEIRNLSEPYGPNHSTASFTRRFIENLRDRSPIEFRNLEAALTVLKDPDRIFMGVRAYEDRDGMSWCFSGQPGGVALAPGGKCASCPGDHVFLVFLNEKLEVQEIRLEDSDRTDPLSPDGWQSRFRDLLWKKPSS